MIRNQYREDSSSGTPHPTQDARQRMIDSLKAQSMPASTNAERADAAPAKPTPSQEAKSARERMIESLKARY